MIIGDSCDMFFTGRVYGVWAASENTLVSVFQYTNKGASKVMLLRRAQYGGRKGRSAERRLARACRAGDAVHKLMRRQYGDAIAVRPIERSELSGSVIAHLLPSYYGGIP